MKNEMIRINAFVESSLWKEVQAFAKANDMSASQVLRKALRDILAAAQGDGGEV